MSNIRSKIFLSCGVMLVILFVHLVCIMDNTTSKVTNMSAMFSGCENLINLQLNNVKTNMPTMMIAALNKAYHPP